MVLPSRSLAVLVLVLPGSMFTWAYERQTSAYGVTFVDRVLRFTAVSVVLHLVLAWPEYGLYRAALADGQQLDSGQFALLWVALVAAVLGPAAAGTFVGGLYASRSGRQGWSRLRSRLSAEREAQLLSVALGRTPAARAWDHFFSERPNAYLRVSLENGQWLAGRFAAGSYAGGFPHDMDLFLEEAWEVDADSGELGPRGLGFPVYIPAATITWFEVLAPTVEEQP